MAPCMPADAMRRPHSLITPACRKSSPPHPSAPKTRQGWGTPRHPGTGIFLSLQDLEKFQCPATKIFLSPGTSHLEKFRKLKFFKCCYGGTLAPEASVHGVLTRERRFLGIPARNLPVQSGAQNFLGQRVHSLVEVGTQVRCLNTRLLQLAQLSGQFRYLTTMASTTSRRTS